MEIIRHRVNTIAELEALEAKYGAEIDIRSSSQGIIVQHEPFSTGELLSDWLSAYQHGTLILNLKESGLVDRVLAMLNQHKIDTFFFLDQDFPTAFQLLISGEKRFAVRVSDYEPVEGANVLAGGADWVWLDTFQSFDISTAQFASLKSNGFLVCVVSPELHQDVTHKEIGHFNRQLEAAGVLPDAVCTKHPEVWESLIS